MRVTEIYASLQGETSYAGRPCTLVRLAGCDLHCTYCDTGHARDGGDELSVDAVRARVDGLGQHLVLVTGGEPLLQPECPELCARLLAARHRVMIETPGAHEISVLPAGVVRVLDIKTPGSGECARNRWENLVHLRATDAVKFVLTDRADYLWAREVMRTYDFRGAEPLLSPVLGRLDPRDLWTWMVEDRLDARLNLQLHKLVHGLHAGGV
jgi:7-carboxy-7-deazaguanine synthase